MNIFKKGVPPDNQMLKVESPRKLEEVGFIWRSCIVTDACDLDTTLISLAKEGKQVFQVLSTPTKIKMELSEPKEEWKEADTKNPHGQIETTLLVLYMQAVPKKDWIGLIIDAVEPVSSLKGK